MHTQRQHREPCQVCQAWHGRYVQCSCVPALLHTRLNCEASAQAFAAALPPEMAGYTIPATIAPIIGATQKSQSCARAQPPTQIAGPVLRAGFTDTPVT